MLLIKVYPAKYTKELTDPTTTQSCVGAAIGSGAGGYHEIRESKFFRIIILMIIIVSTKRLPLLGIGLQQVSSNRSVLRYQHPWCSRDLNPLT